MSLKNFIMVISFTSKDRLTGWINSPNYFIKINGRIIILI